MKNLLYPSSILLLFVFIFFSCQNAEKEHSKTLPNIVFIYLDDLGYGDMGAYGAQNLPTPSMDALANGGVRFTNGYASSATCTPSRYALLTGVYPWRNKKARILPGTAPLLIDTLQMTLPKMLKGQGYRTGIVGKWHLGLGTGQVNWNERIYPGPNDIGFDYSYILAATQDRVPTVYIENGHVDGLDKNDPIEISYDQNFEGEPTGLDNPELLTMKWHHGHNNSIVNGIPRIGFMKGGDAAKWSDVDMADHFLEKSQKFIQQHTDKPFFLFYALQQPHVPRTPHPRFVGSSGMGPRGDVIVEADWCIGQLVATLKEEGLLENTLIILSSDNGPVLNDGYYDEAVEKVGDHQPSGGLRGGKYSLFEAGARVPFVTYWKGTIQPKISNTLICQLDILASLAALTGSKQKVQDSQDLLPVLLGQSDQGRTDLVIEATTRTAYRSGEWVMIPPYKGQKINPKVDIELGNQEEFLLFDLDKDPTQTTNLAKDHPEILKKLHHEFTKIRGIDYGAISKLELK